jgi:hypothetical protein
MEWIIFILGVLGAGFLAFIIWDRRDAIPGAAYWSFAILWAVPIFMLLLKLFDISSPYVTIKSQVRDSLVASA